MDAQGFIIEQHFAEPEDITPLCELVIRSLQAGMMLSDELGKSPLSQQYIEFADGQMTAEVLHEGFVLVVLAGNGANLGRVRLEIRKNKGAVERMLV